MMRASRRYANKEPIIHMTRAWKVLCETEDEEHTDTGAGHMIRQAQANEIANVHLAKTGTLRACADDMIDEEQEYR